MTMERRPALRLPIGLQARLDWLRSRLWFIPGVFAIAAAVGAQVIVAIDRLVDSSLSGDLAGVLFGGGPDGARLVLSTISAAMLSFTGLVFSVTMLVLQQASSQLSPRVMRTFLRDRVNQAVLGLFVATFLFALLVLRDIRSATAGGPFVPAIAVSVAYLLLVASVGAFVSYINHMAQAIRAGTVLRSVGDETRAAIERLYPEGIGDEPDTAPPPLPDREPDRIVVLDRRRGVITSIDDEHLVELATEHDLLVSLPHAIGDFVPQGAPLLAVWSRSPKTVEPPDDALWDRLAATVETGTERTMTQDASFGFRQIVDIAERALSPGVNDPTTALQALDQVHDLLRRLATRRIPSAARLDEAGNVLLRLARPGWDDYVSLAIDEIRQYGSGSIQVARRLRHLLLDLQSVAPSFRQAAITRQLHLLDAGVARAIVLEEDRVAAGRPSGSGQGPTVDPRRIATGDQDGAGD